MPQIIYQNHLGVEMELLGNSQLHITGLQGVSAAAVINTSSTAGFDGATYISSQTPMRNIVLTLHVAGETERLYLYNLFRVKQTGTFFYHGEREAKIQCITESVNCSPTSKPMAAQVSLLCPQPYFESLTVMSATIASLVKSWRFPWTTPPEGMMLDCPSGSLIVNAPNPSEVDVGMDIVFYANSELTNPSVLNVYTNEYIKLSVTMLAGDTITVNTRRGQKGITLTRNGIKSNVFNTRAAGSTFLQLHQGDNIIRYDADTNLGGLEVTFYYTEYYTGV